jgi:hypothetical protein
MSTVEAVQGELGCRIPAALLDVYEGRVAVEGSFVYPLDEVAERNATFEISDYRPDLLLIGDDGGGRGFFIPRDDPEPSVVAIDLGAVGSSDGELLGPLSEWVSHGFDDYWEKPAPGPGIVDVLLARRPEAGARALVRIRQIFNLPVPLGDLTRADRPYPVELLTKVHYVKYQKQIEAINRDFDCLEVRPTTADRRADGGSVLPGR